MILEATKEAHYKISGKRRIALYPGAFRPPHGAHLIAVLDLASRPDIDEVVVIISNRCRIIPGTTKALDANVAQDIWRIYLQGLSKVRIELAAHTAVQHALDYFDHVNPGDTLRFCIGASDLSRGDDRFTKLSDLARHTGVAAELIAAPTGAMTVRSTALRTMLANGTDGCAPFMAALPIPLSEQQRAKVWSISCDGMREVSEIVQEKVGAVMDQSGLGEINCLEAVQRGKIDPVYRVHYSDGRCCFIKYAGDTVGPGCFGQRLIQKPRGRLSTERRALKRLKEHHLDTEVDLPEVVFFDKKTLTLVLSEVCPEGRSLLDDFKHGHFDPTVASAASSFLAGCHTLSSSINPVWGDHEADLTHWEKMLDLRTEGITSEAFPEQVLQHLKTLKHLSDEASKKRVRPQLLMLDYTPKNILIGKERVGVIDFERCSTIGDPAYDFGLFMGHIIFWSVVTASGNACRSAIETSLSVYRERVGNEWLSCRARVVAFAGAALLGQMTEEGHTLSQQMNKTLMQTAATLLSWGGCQDEEIEKSEKVEEIDEIMIHAAIGQLATGSL